MANQNLGEARKTKNDEFYTQYIDIEKEMNAYLDSNPKVFKNKVILLPCDDPEWSNFTKYFAQNFEKLGLKKLVSTSYAPATREKGIIYQPTLFETESPQFDAKKTASKGKIFTLTRDKNGDHRVNVDDLEWAYLEGDGDFRSKEINDLRDEADVIITNPPFSLFREFLGWIVETNKQFLIIGNMNAITYKEVFLLIRDNKMWLGKHSGAMTFRVPDSKEKEGLVVDDVGNKWQNFGNICWYTNVDHGRRHQPMVLMSKSDNIKFSKHKEVKDFGYTKYDNYNAIEVPFTDAIPSDYKGVMGVPISFLDKYSPEQFEILGLAAGNIRGLAGIKSTTGKDGPYINGKLKYGRILIRHKKAEK